MLCIQIRVFPLLFVPAQHSLNSFLQPFYSVFLSLRSQWDVFLCPSHIGRLSDFSPPAVFLYLNEYCQAELILGLVSSFGSLTLWRFFFSHTLGHLQKISQAAVTSSWDAALQATVATFFQPRFFPLPNIPSVFLTHSLFSLLPPLFFVEDLYTQ